jgi:hypothetical protein
MIALLCPAHLRPHSSRLINTIESAQIPPNRVAVAGHGPPTLWQSAWNCIKFFLQ